MEETLNIFHIKEDLVPELEALLYTDKLTGFRIVKHPLVVSCPHDEVLNAWCNRSLKVKRELIDKAIKEQEWEKVVLMYERPFRLESLKKLIHTHPISRKEIGELLLWVWTDSENIFENKRTWTILIKKYKDDIQKAVDPKDKKILRNLPDIFTIYRGCSDKNKNGKSWTLNKEVAAKFSDRHQKLERVSYIKERKIKKEMVAFYTNDRGEEEIVLL